MFDELDRVPICPEKVIYHKALKLHTCITTLILIRAMVKLVFVGICNPFNMATIIRDLLSICT